MHGTPEWLHTVAAAHGAQEHARTERGVTVRRVTGGANNALYRVEAGGHQYACKLCVVDERQRARHEYGALRLLQAVGLDLAPQPLRLDESCAVVPYPVVVYRWLPGAPLGPALTTPQLAALIESIQHLHGIRPEEVEDRELPDAWFHWFDFARYLDEIHSLLAEDGAWLAATDPQGQELRGRLARLVQDCADLVANTGADPRRERVPLCLCRVDPGLANALWCDDGRLRWVDWEYSGWGDPALDLADLRWHAALDQLSPAEHDWLRNSYRRPAGDDGFEARLRVWDRLLATRWAFRVLHSLRSKHHGPDREWLTQPATDAATLRALLIRFIERAERVATGAAPGLGYG